MKQPNRVQPVETAPAFFRGIKIHLESAWDSFFGGGGRILKHQRWSKTKGRTTTGAFVFLFCILFPRMRGVATRARRRARHPSGETGSLGRVAPAQFPFEAVCTLRAR